nr:serine hydrolase domain-containing protein [uncultured Hyphomonas sp.]
MRVIILLISMMTMQTCAAMAETSADVREALSGFAKQFQLPGVSLTVIEEGEIVEDTAIGFADLEQQVPMRTDTLNRIGSISKTMTAAAALKMVASGQIDLGREVSAYLDDFDGPARDVTLRQLMSHTGCVRGYRDGEGISYTHYEDSIAPLELFREDPLECVPGGQFIYSSYGYALMDAVMVRASGEDFQSLMKELVWTPLGLEQVALDDLRKVISWRARNYDLDAEGLLVNAPYSDSSYKYAGAGMLASTRDLARFGAALMDGAFVTDEARSEMFAPALLKDGTAIDYGLGLYVDFARFIEARRAYIPDALYESLMAQASQHKVYWHSGTSEGAVAILMMEPETGRVVALATNRGGVEKEAIVFTMSLITLLGEQ